MCRVADASASIFAKALTFKIWDVAPAQVILDEAGCAVGTWSGEPVVYDSSTLRFRNILAAPHGLFVHAARELTSLAAEV